MAEPLPLWRTVSLLTAKAANPVGDERCRYCISPMGNDFIVVASQGGSSQRPGWYLNLKTGPSGALTIGRQRFPILARE